MTPASPFAMLVPATQQDWQPARVMDMTSKRLYPIHRVPAVGARILSLALALLLCACASQNSFRYQVAPLRGQTIPPIEDVDFHTISPAMVEFLDQHVAKDVNKEHVAWSLVFAVMDRNVLPFDYDPATTLSPVETFTQHTGNCLSFSVMLVTMARYLGLRAWYQEVEIPPEWQNVNRTLLISMHVNVVIEGKRDQWMVDISGRNSSMGRKLTRITDANAAAQYYNNLGADALTENELPLAYAYFLKAMEREPDLPFLWSNLAVVYSRAEQHSDAKASYLEALRIDPDNPIAANNLYLIYERDGEHDASQKLLAQVERHRRQNPYYLAHLSALAYEEGHYVESREMLEKAILIKEQEYRFHYELARVLAGEGDRVAAQASLDRAMQLAPNLPWLTSAAVDQLPPLPE